MKKNARVLTIQDISCLGQCSMTVALPVLSACGAECAVLPTAILSTHTGPEFQTPTFRDLTADIPLIAQSWAEQGICFDAISIGYLGSERQIGHVSRLLALLKNEETLVMLDPVMGDNGKFYSGFDESYARAMRALCAKCDILLPNLTECAFLLGEPPAEEQSEARARQMARQLSELGPKTVLITGIDCPDGQIGNYIWRGAEEEGVLVTAPRLPGRYHGTGDLFAAALLGGLTQGKTLEQAAERASAVVYRAIEQTEPEHTYGVRFERALGMLTERA